MEELRIPVPTRIVVSRCHICQSRFNPKSKVSCLDCGINMHYDCAIYEDDDSKHMLCLNCYRNRKIERGLERDGVYVLDGLNDFDKCKFCGWRCDFLDSHIEYGSFKCKYITDRYELKLDDIGDVVYKKK